MSERVYLSSPHMGGDEIKYVQEAFDSNWIAPLGPNVNNFEKEMATYAGIGHAAALSSGTAALHLALILLGVESGDEVLVSSFTFSASVNPIVYQQATPILIDSEELTWNMSPEYARKAIEERIRKGRKPKAIILVHLYGMPAQLGEFQKISAEYDIPLIEDAAESLGSKYKGIQTGTLGKFGVFSFNGNKIITTSGGGCLISNDEKMIDKSRFLATQSRDPAPHYQHSEIGYNYRMSNITAGIGRGQLLVLDQWVEKRRKHFEEYKNSFRDLQVIRFLEEPKDAFANRWLTCMTIQDDGSHNVSREDLRLALEAENIESRPLWKPMHLQPVFKDCPYFGDGTSERLFDDGLCLPSGSNMSAEDRERIINIIKGHF